MTPPTPSTPPTPPTPPTREEIPMAVFVSHRSLRRPIGYLLAPLVVLGAVSVTAGIDLLVRAVTR
jgi:hypothetical protein